MTCQSKRLVAVHEAEDLFPLEKIWATIADSHAYAQANRSDRRASRSLWHGLSRVYFKTMRNAEAICGCHPDLTLAEDPEHELVEYLEHTGEPLPPIFSDETGNFYLPHPRNDARLSLASVYAIEQAGVGLRSLTNIGDREAELAIGLVNDRLLPGTEPL